MADAVLGSLERLEAMPAGVPIVLPFGDIDDLARATFHLLDDSDRPAALEVAATACPEEGSVDAYSHDNA